MLIDQRLFIFRLTTTIIGRYWYLVNATLNDKEYRYFAFGMHDRMDTPPTYSYVCSSAMFVRYERMTESYGKYNFSDKFYLTDLQVNKLFLEKKKSNSLF
jgi:hypothetical protein